MKTYKLKFFFYDVGILASLEMHIEADDRDNAYKLAYRLKAQLKASRVDVN